MRAKALEIRDAATFIPALAVDMNTNEMSTSGAQRWLLRRAGYAVDSYPCIMLLSMNGGLAHCDPYHWSDRTFKVAHNYITENWHRLNDGDVVDVEHILGETENRKISERFESV